jgi:hypothetical protein
MDNLSAKKTPTIRAWEKKNKVELCLTPTYASWANPIEAQRGRPAPRRRDQTLRTFVVTALAVGRPRLLSHTEAEHRYGARLGVAERFQVDPVEAWGREADAVAQ